MAGAFGMGSLPKEGGRATQREAIYGTQVPGWGFRGELGAAHRGQALALGEGPGPPRERQLVSLCRPCTGRGARGTFLVQVLGPQE